MSERTERKFEKKEVSSVLPSRTFFLQAHEILEYLDQESQALWTHLEIFLDMWIIRKILCKKSTQIKHFFFYK